MGCSDRHRYIEQVAHGVEQANAPRGVATVEREGSSPSMLESWALARAREKMIGKHRRLGRVRHFEVSNGDSQYQPTQLNPLLLGRGHGGLRRSGRTG
jgi:hypothetical protein